MAHVASGYVDDNNITPNFKFSVAGWNVPDEYHEGMSMVMPILVSGVQAYPTREIAAVKESASKYTLVSDMPFDIQNGQFFEIYDF